MEEPKLTTKPDPIARQSDLILLEAKNRTQHIITRAMLIIFATPNVAKALPYVLGAIGAPTGWIPWS